MRKILMGALLAAAPLSACTTYGDGYGYRGDGGRQYREGTYEPYALGPSDTVYRGEDGRYYCRRHDGTVGLVVGAGVGALLGNLIAPRGSKTLGTVIGAAGGAVVGAAIDRGDMRCQ